MLKIMNPATEMILRELPEDNAATVSEKYKRARHCQPDWAATPLKDRIACVRRFKDLVERERDTLARTLTEEVGKPITQSHNELKGLVGRLDFFADNVTQVIHEETVLDDTKQNMKERITLEPLGVIGNISAWNYPYFVGSNVFIPALLTGNTVLYKPSEFATLTGLAIERLLREAGVMPDAFITLVGSGAVGVDLLNQPINGIFFTGSFATGKKIAAAAAPKMMKVQMELGGKDPVYVTEDVDLAAAAASSADGAFYNAGQSCCSVERIYVHHSVYEAFIDAFMKEVRGFTVGNPTDEKTYIGPLARAPQLNVLERQVADAMAKGARLLCGGHRLNRTGYYFEPTVLVDVNHSMELMREESFGPIIGIQRVHDDAQALNLMNDTEYGLTAGVYCRSQTRAEMLMTKLQAGSVYWNCCDRVSPRLPWSGRGHSGVGCTLSTYGIQAFLQPKAWHLKRV